jgi:hypothetical protein
MNDDDVRAGQARPSIARAYNYLLGGHDYYAVDEKYAQHFDVALPGSASIAVTNRRAVERAVREIARQGIRQFLDFGCGLPAFDNVHQIAQRHDPAARVVYIDNDPIVVAHALASLVTDERTAVVQGDVRDPKTISASPEIERVIDFDAPVGLLFSAVLGFVDDEEDPAGLVRYWVDRVASGSRIYISHFRSGPHRETAAAEQQLQGTFGRGRWRSDREILRLLADLDVLEPGLVPCVQWRPDPAGDPAQPGSHPAMTPWEQLIVAGLARKP